MTNAELAAYLSHPDAFVRSMADHALRARRPTGNNLPDNGIPAYRFEDGLLDRLARLEDAGLVASDHYYI